MVAVVIRSKKSKD